MNILQLSTAYIKSRALNSVLNIVLLSLGIATIVLLLLFSDQMQKRLTSDAEGLDLVVGAKGSPMQLILSSIYHIDIPTGNIPYPRVEWMRSNRLVKEVIPVALGDSYKGFRIVGTEHAYPQHYGIELQGGHLWDRNFEVLIGHRVATELGLKLGDKFFGSHGMVDGGHVHENQAYTVAGIMKKDNSVMDRLILTSVPTVWYSHNLVEGHDDHGEHDEHHEGDHDHDSHGHHEDDGHTADEHRAMGVSHNEADQHHEKGHDHDAHGHHEDDGHTADEHRKMGVAHSEADPHHEKDHDHDAHGHHEDDGHTADEHRKMGVAHNEADPHHEKDHDHDAHGHHEDDGHTADEHRKMGVAHNEADPHHEKGHDHDAHGHHEDDGHTADEHRKMDVAHSEADPHHEKDHDHDAHGHHEDDGHTADEHRKMGVVHNEADPHHEKDHDHDSHGHHDDHHGHDAHSEEELLASIDTSQQEITSLLVKYRSPLGAVQVPMIINRQSEMQAAAPATETARLFALLGGVIETLYGFGFLLVITSGLGVFIALYNAMKDRRYDLAIMRSLGASRGKLLAGVILEGVLLVLMGTALGFLIGHGVAQTMGELMPKAKEMGLTGSVWVMQEWAVLLMALGVALVASILPAIQAYRTDIAETLSKSK